MALPGLSGTPTTVKRVSLLANAQPATGASLSGDSTISEPDVEKLGMMLRTVSDIERVGDHAKNIAEYALQLEQTPVSFSDKSKEELQEMSDDSVELVELALDIFKNYDSSRLSKVEELEQNVDNISAEYIENHIKRLKQGECDPRSGVIFTDVITDLERCADHATNIAFSVLGETAWDPRNQRYHLARDTE